MYFLDDWQRDLSRLVVKDNSFVRDVRKPGLTSAQITFLDHVISFVKKGDKEFKPVDIYVEKYCKLTGCSPDGMYSDFKQMVSDLESKVFWVKINGIEHGYNWLSVKEIHPGFVRVCLSED